LKLRHRLINRCGNGFAALLFGLITLAQMRRGNAGTAMVASLLAALGIFNILLIEKMNRLLSEFRANKAS
jgi:hypothetical protein